jgi:hypothetical protein
VMASVTVGVAPLLAEKPNVGAAKNRLPLENTILSRLGSYDLTQEYSRIF